MPNFLIYLSWERDAAGYELLPAIEAQPAAPLPLNRGATLQARPVLSGGSPGRPERIVPRGGHMVQCRPLNEADRLYCRFARVDSPETLIAFINQWGPLTAAGQSREQGDEVPSLLKHAQAFRDWLGNQQHDHELHRWVGKEGLVIARLEAVLAQDPDSGGVQLQYRPQSLLGALWLQLMQKVTGNMAYQECTYCRQWFEVGPGTGRRLDAKFCSPDHQIRFNRHKASKGIAAHA